MFNIRELAKELHDTLIDAETDGSNYRGVSVSIDIDIHDLVADDVSFDLFKHRILDGLVNSFEDIEGVKVEYSVRHDINESNRDGGHVVTRSGSLWIEAHTRDRSNSEKESEKIIEELEKSLAEARKHNTELEQITQSLGEVDKRTEISLNR